MKLFKNAHLNHSTPFLFPTQLKNHLKLTHLAFSPRWILLRMATGCDEITSFHWKLSSSLSCKSKTLPFEFPMKIAIFFSLAFRYLTLWISNKNATFSLSQSNILPFEFPMEIAIYFLSQIKYLTLWISNEKCDLFSLEINYLTLWISNGNC